MLEISITAADAGLTSFGDGAVGFYNYSQSNARYAGLAEQALPDPDASPVNATAMFALFLLGLAGIRVSYKRN